MIIFCPPLDLVHAENVENNINKLEKEKQIKREEQNKNKLAEIYLLGPNDVIFINFVGLIEYSSTYRVESDGYLYLPESVLIKAEDLTISELKDKLVSSYSKYIIDPIFDLKILNRRPIRVSIVGEVKRPGLYTLSEPVYDIELKKREKKESIFGPIQTESSSPKNFAYTPTVYDAIRKANGITPYSDLSGIVLKRFTKENGEKIQIKTTLNLLELLMGGDQSQNLKLFDGDILLVKKSQNYIPDQINLARNSNLNDDIVSVFVSGQMTNTGYQQLPSGSSLNQAIALSGGKKFLSGNIEFLRFGRDGKVEKRKFNYRSEAKIGSYKNPVLLDSDIIHINRSLIGTGTEFLGKILAPYSMFKIIND